MPLKSCLSKGNLRDLDTSNSSSGSFSSRELMKRNVSFCRIEVREYDQTISDNPCVSKGPAIGLDWQYQECGSYEVDEYELHKAPHRRTKSMMIIPPFLRERQLRHEWDVSSKEIKKMEKQVSQNKRQRHYSINNPESLERTLDALNTAKRGVVKRMRFLRKKKRDEKELLQQYYNMSAGQESSCSKRMNKIKSHNDLQLMSKHLQELEPSTDDEPTLSRKPMCKSMVDLSKFNTVEEEESATESPPNKEFEFPIASDETDDTIPADDWGFDFEDNETSSSGFAPFAKVIEASSVHDVDLLRSLDSSRVRKQVV